MAKDKPSGSGRAKVPPKSPSSFGSGSTKKMGSLSSFQPTLSFSSVPWSTKVASSSSSTTVDDRQRMPPPASAVVPKKASTVHNGNGHRSNAPKVFGKGKGRANDPLSIDSDDEDLSSGLNVTSSHSSQMWTDLYTPQSESELAPGKARIAKVRNWLHEAIYGHPPEYSTPPGGLAQASIDKIRKYKRILLLTGPAGTGKTTTVRLLAKEMDIELVEWSEGSDERSLGGGIEHESSITKISSFLSRNSFTPLSLSSNATSSLPGPSKNRPRMLLLTSLPNLTHLLTRDAFHAALLNFCHSFISASCPLVIVHSDAGSGGRAEESWMDRERGGREGASALVGREVREGPWCQEVDFISLAPTFITKALTRVLTSAVPDPAKRPPVSALQLIALISNGDLRSAINSLQLLCSRSYTANTKKRKKRDDEDSDGTSRRKTGKGSKGGKGAKLDVSDDLRAVLDAVTRREQSLGLFHALGKVFYNKRLGDPGEEDEDAEVLAVIKGVPPDDPLPTHLSDFDRRKSLVQMEAFMPTIPVDASSFALWIHQSLPNFCQEVEEVSQTMDDLCAADLMRTDDDIWQSSPQAIAYALHLTVRGTHMALPSPVIRKNQKIIKPHFFQSFRTERENFGHLDTAAGYLAKKAVALSSKIAEKPLHDTAEGAWGGLPTKLVLATEMVPMMIKIQGLSTRPLLPGAVKPLSLPTYQTSFIREDELRATDELPEETMDASQGGEDGLGEVVAGGGWDEGNEVEEAVEAEDLEEIEDW